MSGSGSRRRRGIAGQLLREPVAEGQGPRGLALRLLRESGKRDDGDEKRRDRRSHRDEDSATPRWGAPRRDRGARGLAPGSARSTRDKLDRATRENERDRSAADSRLPERPRGSGRAARSPSRRRAIPRRAPWGFRVSGRAPEPRSYDTDTPEFLYWQIAASLDRGRGFWSRKRPSPGAWIPGPVLPAIPVEGTDLNAYYDREALRFFRDRDDKTGEVVQSGDSPDIVTHEQGHAILDALRPDLWDAPHFEVAAFHEAFGDLGRDLDRPRGAGARRRASTEETGGDAAKSNLVSRLAEELGARRARPLRARGRLRRRPSRRGEQLSLRGSDDAARLRARLARSRPSRTRSAA